MMPRVSGAERFHSRYGRRSRECRVAFLRARHGELAPKVACGYNRYGSRDYSRVRNRVPRGAAVAREILRLRDANDDTKRSCPRT
jgi:hypothetical protein